MYRYHRLTKLSAAVTSLVGHPITFVVIGVLVLLWMVVWYLRGFDAGWLVFFSTATTVATFLLVFVVQHTQDREAAVIEIKLNELIRTSKGAHNALLDLEKLPDQDVEYIRAGYAELAAGARTALGKGELESATAVVEVRSLNYLIEAEKVLRDPKRLAALSRLELSPDEYLDQLTRLAQLALGAPIALVTMITPDKQLFKGQSGLPSPVSESRETPLSHSFCKNVVLSGKPFIVNDARENPLVKENGAVKDFGVAAYCGVPLVSGDQQQLGSFCAIDMQPRVWQKKELEILQVLSSLAALHLQQRARSAA